MPVVKPKKLNPRGFGAGIRNEIYDEEIYKERSVCEGSFIERVNLIGGVYLPSSIKLF